MNEYKRREREKEKAFEARLAKNPEFAANKRRIEEIWNSPNLSLDANSSDMREINRLSERNEQIRSNQRSAEFGAWWSGMMSGNAGRAEKKVSSKGEQLTREITQKEKAQRENDASHGWTTGYLRNDFKKDMKDIHEAFQQYNAEHIDKKKSESIKEKIQSESKSGLGTTEFVAVGEEGNKHVIPLSYIKENKNGN